ncbi:hypothetical protein TRIUR3_28727 [Triticum urartu]|uniref:Uncharacterized protein n=1 Tax=Triticum urartu TaxID=4572 RepID=M7ZEU4_TRIUA|nr:hypothetical protein TRIUR3_28727 [Triticum urartu]
MVVVIHGGALVAEEGPRHEAHRGRQHTGRAAAAAQRRCRHRRRNAMAEEGLVHGREQQGGAGGRRRWTWAPVGGRRRHKSVADEREVRRVSGAAFRGGSGAEDVGGKDEA